MAEYTECACGCGNPARRRYLPGHDSKHVSQLFRLVLKGELRRREAAKLLPTQPLKAKLRGRLDAAKV